MHRLPHDIDCNNAVRGDVQGVQGPPREDGVVIDDENEPRKGQGKLGGRMDSGDDKRYPHILAFLIDKGSGNRNGREQSARVIERLRYAHDGANKRAGAIEPHGEKLRDRARDNVNKHKREQALHAMRKHNVGAYHGNRDERCKKHESINVQIVFVHNSHRDADKLSIRIVCRAASPGAVNTV